MSYLEGLKYLIVNRRGCSDIKIILHPGFQTRYEMKAWHDNKAEAPFLKSSFISSASDLIPNQK